MTGKEGKKGSRYRERRKEGELGQDKKKEGEQGHEKKGRRGAGTGKVGKKGSRDRERRKEGKQEQGTKERRGAGLGEEGRENMIWVYTVQYKERVHPRMQRSPKALDKNGIITAASSFYVGFNNTVCTRIF
jgi:hypothetical protein